MQSEVLEFYDNNKNVEFDKDYVTNLNSLLLDLSLSKSEENNNKFIEEFAILKKN